MHLVWVCGDGSKHSGRTAASTGPVRATDGRCASIERRCSQVEYIAEHRIAHRSEAFAVDVIHLGSRITLGARVIRLIAGTLRPFRLCPLSGTADQRSRTRNRRPRLEPTVSTEATEVAEVPETSETAEPPVEGPDILSSGSERPRRSRPAPGETGIREVRHGTRIRHDTSSGCSHIGYCCGGSSSGTESEQGCDCCRGDRRADCELVHCPHLHFLSVLRRLVRCLRWVDDRTTIDINRRGNGTPRRHCQQELADATSRNLGFPGSCNAMIVRCVRDGVMACRAGRR